jgi:WD40 repeat protein
VSELDLHPSNENLVLTSSWDAQLKLWDLRRMAEDSPLQQFTCSLPLNSAQFSLLPGHRVVTNDTQDTMYVFEGFPLRLRTTLPHSHVQQQRNPLLRARLHPLCADLVLVPFCNNADSFCRASIDLLDVSSGNQILRLSVRPIIARSLIEFSSSGEMFASAYTNTLSVWTTPAQTNC